jgi:hypothetical protein
MWRKLGVEQPSPEGPSAHRQWSEPEWLLDGSIQQEPKVYDPTRHHTLSARREGSDLLVDWDFSGQVAEPPDKLLVRVNSKQEPDICPRVFTFTLADPPQPTIDTHIELNPTLGYDVHLSTIDVRGEASASVYCFVGPPVAQDPLVQRVLRAVGAWLYRLFGREGA